MNVTNLSPHCFVLSAGVIIQPSPAEVTVDDDAYRTDTTLNAQIDSLQAQDLISITGKPSDPFQNPRTINSSGQIDGPISVEGSDPSEAVFEVVGAVGQTSELLGVNTQDVEVFVISAEGGVTMTPQDPDSAALGITAAPGAALAAFYVFDNTGVYGTQIGDGVAANIEVGGNGDDSGAALLHLTYDTDGNQSMVTAFTVGPRGEVSISGLPTSDPHVLNQLWNSAGTLKVSAG